MRRGGRANRLAEALGVAAMAGAGFALLAGGGCELAVTDAIPAFTCEPGVAGNCPTDSVCIPSTRQCAPRAGTCTPGASTGCAAGSQCDSSTLRCIAAVADASGDATSSSAMDSGSDLETSSAPDASHPADASMADAPEGDAGDAGADVQGECRGMTCKCSGPSDCDSGICASQLASLDGDKGFCTLTCCTSADCPAGTVCYGTGGGGDFCVPPSWIGRAATLGEGQGGATCGGGGDCRSGLCVGSACADTCCSTAEESSECAAGQICRFAAFPGTGVDTHETAWCGPSTCTKVGCTAGGAPCAVDGTCESGKCGSFGRCEDVCRSSTDCATTGEACSYGLAPTLPTNKDIIAGCVVSTGTTPNGSACMMNTDCLSGFCDGTQCTNVCVADSDCATGQHCVLKTVQVEGSYSVLCCES
jgi:hypothetical protein